MVQTMDGADQEHKFQSAHQLYLATKKPFRDLDIPPRKLLNRHLAQNDSPRLPPEEALFQKFLPYNNSGLDDDSDPYASDHFRMYEFKIRKCTRSRSHDWTDCPFAHPGEKARRRCPLRFNYSGTVCPDFRRGNCGRGDSCDFAHGVFETWLHPSRYRTEACKDGKSCQRKICFFAHTPAQLRSPPPVGTPNNHLNSGHNHVNSGHCPKCRCHPGIPHTTSPTSILDLDTMSPSASPSFSPANRGAGLSPVSRFSDRLARSDSTQHGHSGSSYMNDSNNKLMSPQAIIELMNSMKAMNTDDRNSTCMDSFIDGNNSQSLFAFSPGSRRGECNLGFNNLGEDRFIYEGSAAGPDIDWVKDLLT